MCVEKFLIYRLCVYAHNGLFSMVSKTGWIDLLNILLCFGFSFTASYIFSTRRRKKDEKKKHKNVRIQTKVQLFLRGLDRFQSSISKLTVTGLFRFVSTHHLNRSIVCYAHNAIVFTFLFSEN